MKQQQPSDHLIVEKIKEENPDLKEENPDLKEEHEEQKKKALKVKRADTSKVIYSTAIFNNKYSKSSYGHHI